MKKILKNIKQSINKDVRNLFTLKAETGNTSHKDIRSLFRLKKENEAIKDRMIRDIKVV